MVSAWSAVDQGGSPAFSCRIPAACSSQTEFSNVCGTCLTSYVNAYTTTQQLKPSNDAAFVIRQLTATRNLACARDPARVRPRLAVVRGVVC